MTSDSSTQNDPIGKAIQDYLDTGISQDIIVESDVIDDDVLPSAYLFRTYAEMPDLEKIALKQCKGKILDIGAGSGIHTKYLKEKGFDVTAIDTSPGAVSAMTRTGLNAAQKNFFEFDQGTYDTLLFLMNGTGIAGTLDRFPQMLSKAKELLNPGGVILMDSTDIRYIYEDDDGSIWIDLNGSYFGEVEFNMKYKDQESGWFNWLYLDEETLKKIAEDNGLKVKILGHQDDQYLAELTRK